jgi:hypothetical protein
MAQKQLYVLKVALSHDKSTWRRIEILGSQSLDTLHEIIFEAFDRYEPHMYSFFMTKAGSKSRSRFAQAKEYTHPFAVEAGMAGDLKAIGDASKTALSDLGLKVKGKFEYLFDFGEDWLHEVTVEKIVDIFPDHDYPIITKKKGESPSQYEDYEEEEEDDDDDAEQFGEPGNQIRNENAELLRRFSDNMAAKNLSAKTIRKHLDNIDFYINEFLLYEEPLPPEDGVSSIDYFFGSWFIRKAMWASVTSIKDNIASLKRFYAFMHEIGRISREELAEMKKDIKMGKEEWLETLKRYDDPDTDMGDVWPF